MLSRSSIEMLVARTSYGRCVETVVCWPHVLCTLKDYTYPVYGWRLYSASLIQDIEVDHGQKAHRKMAQGAEGPPMPSIQDWPCILKSVRKWVCVSLQFRKARRSLRKQCAFHLSSLMRSCVSWPFSLPTCKLPIISATLSPRTHSLPSWFRPAYVLSSLVHKACVANLDQKANSR